ncbi:MAG: hypothetical protein WED09_06925 [Homoserinimonas sp.]
MKDSTNPEVSTADRFRAFAEVEARGMGRCYEEWAGRRPDEPGAGDLAGLTA